MESYHQITFHLIPTWYHCIVLLIIILQLQVVMTMWLWKNTMVWFCILQFSKCILLVLTLETVFCPTYCRHHNGKDLPPSQIAVLCVWFRFTNFHGLCDFCVILCAKRDLPPGKIVLTCAISILKKTEMYILENGMPNLTLLMTTYLCVYGHTLLHAIVWHIAIRENNEVNLILYLQ